MRPDLAQRTISAAQWRFLASFVEAFLLFGVGIILARLLPLEDFGLLALATILIGLAGLLSTLGLGPTIIQQRPLTKRHIPTRNGDNFVIGRWLESEMLDCTPGGTP